MAHRAKDGCLIPLRYSSPGKGGCLIPLVLPGETREQRLDELLIELGRRRMTNVLVEGGGRLLGSFLDLRQIDEVHVFIAPRLVGGESAPSPLAGDGIATLSQALSVTNLEWQRVGTDLYASGRPQADQTTPGPHRA